VTEEDLKVRVVCEWLRDHGIAPSELYFEESFSIIAGKGTRQVPRRVGVRADILVKRNGVNLLVIETKAPDEALTDDDRNQAVSYARLVAEGNLVPFAVVTNGRRTRVYDSITKLELPGGFVPSDHEYVRNGYIAVCDELEARVEALELFLGLSNQNLMDFCREQTKHRMLTLRSEDPRSGRKYIPDLYVERVAAHEKLARLLSVEKLILVVGRPQVGKTNFMCAAVERMLAEDEPCLFYTAVGMRAGVFEEFAEDLGWTFRDSSSVYALVSRRERAARRNGRRVAVFIDGLNEGAVSVIRAIERDSSRLDAAGVRFVVSLTNVTAQRLLRDRAGTENWLAVGAHVPEHGIDLLQTEPLLADKGWSVIALGPYTDEERLLAYERYRKSFNVRVTSDHVPTSDPLLLRIAMERSSGGELACELAEADLISATVAHKLRRSGLDAAVGVALLTSVAEIMFEHGAPTPLRHLQAQFALHGSMGPPSTTVDAALLTHVQDGHRGTSVDFYSSRERDYAIASARGWLSGDPLEFLEREYCFAVRHASSVDALRWLLRQQRSLERALERDFSNYREAGLRLLLVEGSVALARTALDAPDGPSRRERRKHSKDLLSWLETIARTASTDPEMNIRAEGAKLIAFIGDGDWLATAIEDDARFLTRLMEIDAVVPFVRGGAGAVVLEAFHTWVLDEAVMDLEESPLLATLEGLVRGTDDVVARGALKVIAHLLPEHGLALAAGRAPLPLFERCPDEWRQAVSAAAELAARTLDVVYYGDICPGMLNSLKDDPELHWEEYERLEQLFRPVMQLTIGLPGNVALHDLLAGIKPTE
jgi:hypothetical protein